MKHIVALLSLQGTACPETALYDDEDTPENRAAVENGVPFSVYPHENKPIAGSWTDVSSNDYFGSDVERIIDSIRRNA